MEKKYLHCTVINNGGTMFTNPLKLSEAHYISQLAQENKQVLVKLMICSAAQYKSIFG
jgi:hypothetical protein